MTASHIRADMFSEFITPRRSRQQGDIPTPGPTHASPATSPDDNSTGGATNGEPFSSSSFPTDSVARDLPDARSTMQEQPLLQLLQALALNGGQMCIKRLLQSQIHPKLDTLRQLDQLKKLDFIEITATPDEDMVQLTTLGRWAAKYAD